MPDTRQYRATRPFKDEYRVIEIGVEHSTCMRPLMSLEV